MTNIAILSSSIRTDRNSHRVALYFKAYLENNGLAHVEMLDLKDYNFPLFNERLSKQSNPLPGVLDFAKKINAADGVVIITPEYNGGYPASLKNAIDVLYDEWYRKPVAICTVSIGAFGGSQVITSLQFSLWKIHAMTIPVLFPVPNVLSAFDVNGIPMDKAKTDQQASEFINELLWYIDIKSKRINIEKVS